MSPNWTAKYAVSMGSLVLGGFWVAALMLSFDSAGDEVGRLTKGVGVFALGVSVFAAAILLATSE